MLKIGDFSKLSRISIRMLRHYDEIGLLVPEEIDNFTNYRFYSEKQLPLACRITALKEMGFSLASASEILKCYDSSQELERYLLLKQTEIREQVKDSNRRLLLLETTINRLRKEDNIMKYDVILKEFPERYVASVRKIIDAYDKEGMLWNILMTETAPLHIQFDNPCYSLAIFHDGEYKERDVDVEVQLSVRGDFKNTENVVFKTVAPILMASATYKGSYEQITEVNHSVANWILDNGYEFNGVNFCIYHVSPNETSNPEELVTEVCYPVKKK